MARFSHIILCSLSALGLAVAGLRAQSLPDHATIEELATAFLMRISSSDAAVDRSAFGSRLIGGLADVSPVQFKGTAPDGARMMIDTLLTLEREGEPLRTVAYVTLSSEEETENLYLFFVCDSIWRIEGVRRFPGSAQRKQLRESLDGIDTASSYGRTLYADVTRLLLPDDSLRARLAVCVDDAAKIVRVLGQSRFWTRFLLREIQLAGIDEYRELDDDISPDHLIFYKLNREAVDRLRRRVGIVWIERDGRYPGALFLVGGSIGETTYGYLYAPSADALPTVSVGEFFMLKPIATDWWLYKRVGG